jgi:phosphate uptake regulator
MMDEEIDRHYFTLVRAIRAYARSGRLPTVRLLDLRLVAKFVEDIGDRLVRKGWGFLRCRRPELYR